MSEHSSKMELLGNAPVSKSLMALGVPIMIGMTINALYNLADAYFVGGLGEGPMGAISIVFPLGQAIVGLGLMGRPPAFRGYWDAATGKPPTERPAPHCTAGLSWERL